MDNAHGAFIWYDLVTTSLDEQVRFYSAIVGWSTKDAGQAGMRHLVLNPPGSPDGMGIGGMMEMPKALCDAGVMPAWNGYLFVPDVDAYATRVEKLGGKIHQPPADIPNIGRFAFVSDPQGATFYLFRPNGSASGPLPSDHTPGHIGWRELVTSDWQAAYAFYSELFGWTKGTSVDMGKHGVYQLWHAKNGQGGGMMNAMNPSDRPAWRFYASVAGVMPLADKIQAGGGKITMPPHEVPGGAWITNFVDPIGAAFAITGPKG